MKNENYSLHAWLFDNISKSCDPIAFDVFEGKLKRNKSYLIELLIRNNIIKKKNVRVLWKMIGV